VIPATGSVQGTAPVLFLMTNSLETGGSERQFATLASALKPEHLQVRLGCLRRIGPFAERLEEIVEFPPGGSLFKLPAQRARLDLARYLRANRVVIAHSFDFYSNLMMIPSARLARVPIVVGSQRQLGDLLSSFRNRVQHALFRWCDRVVCNSQAAAARLRQAGIGTNRLVVIPNALPGAAFAAVAPALPVTGGMRVVMIARMNDPGKRHDIFLQAAARLAAKHPKLEFMLVGDGPLRPGLEAMVGKLGLRERVIFMGERHDIPAVLAASEISVLPSISESLSNSIMESMAAGVPVVACRAGGNDELIRDGENGFLVPTADAEALAERIDTLVQQPELRKSLGVTARQDARRFSVERVCGKYERLYASLLEEKGIGRADVVLSGAGRS
jgi:glycosyltransferase involved in cell wall biosynthesis